MHANKVNIYELISPIHLRPCISSSLAFLWGKMANLQIFFPNESTGGHFLRTRPVSLNQPFEWIWRKISSNVTNFCTIAKKLKQPLKSQFSNKSSCESTRIGDFLWYCCNKLSFISDKMHVLARAVSLWSFEHLSSTKAYYVCTFINHGSCKLNLSISG